MENGLLLVFTKEKIAELMTYDPDKIVVSTIIEAHQLADNTMAGVVKVKAHAMQSGNDQPLATVDGCPNPPCNSY